MNNKKILYIYMDDVLVDFQTGIDRLDGAGKNEHTDHFRPNLDDQVIALTS